MEHKSTDQLHEQQHHQPVLLQAVSIRLIYTGIIFMGHLSFGLIAGLGGPSLVDIRYLMTDDSAKEPAPLAQLSLGFTFTMIGAVCGGFISFLYKLKLLEPYLNRQLLTSILFIIFGLVSGYVPQLRSVYLYYGLSFVGGIGAGNWNAIAITWLIEMWTGKVLAAILQALQLSYGVGTILGPLIVRPYLYGYMNATEVQEMNITEYRVRIEERRHTLTFPYVVVGVSVACVGLSLLILYFTWFFRYRRASPEGDSSSSSDPNSNSKPLERKENQTQLRIFLGLILLIFAGNNLAEIGYNSFLDTFLQSLSSVKISAAQAAEIGSITATSYTVGRGASILVSMILSAGNLLLVHYGLALFGFTAMLWSTRQPNTTLIRVNSGLIGYSFSAIMPAMFAYINNHIQVDDRRNAMFTIALTVPSIFTPLIIGHYIEHYPSILLYLDLVVLLIALGFFLGVRLGVVRKQEKQEAQRKRWDKMETEEYLKYRGE